MSSAEACMFFTPLALFSSDLFTWLHFHGLRTGFGDNFNTKKSLRHPNPFNTFLNRSASLAKHARTPLINSHLDLLTKQPAELDSFRG
ncbi:MAG: hypothetical protein HOP33_02230 [Verrucomicrobia bacterium]|nr:hypothetical protein [Verrucomicrobiota bacterium]